MLCCIYAVCKVRWGAAAALDGHIHQGNTFVSLQHNEAVPQPTHDCPNHCYHVRNSIAASVLQVHGLENVSFRCIIAAYRRQPQAKPDTYNSGGSGAAGCTCAVLCCAVLCCAVLCCAMLCCDVLCYAVLDCSGFGRSSKQRARVCPLCFLVCSWQQHASFDTSSPHPARAAVSLTPREATTPHLAVTQRGDIIAFYNQAGTRLCFQCGMRTAAACCRCPPLRAFACTEPQIPSLSPSLLPARCSCPPASPS